MQKIKRVVTSGSPEKFKIKRMGLNDTGVFSIICNEKNEEIEENLAEIIFNFDKEETSRIKEFLGKWQ
jgi:dihydroorotate dehydrogenase